MSPNTLMTTDTAEPLTLGQIRQIISRRYGEDGDGAEYLALVALYRMAEADEQGFAWYYCLPRGHGYGLTPQELDSWTAAHLDSYASAVAWCNAHINR